MFNMKGNPYCEAEWNVLNSKVAQKGFTWGHLPEKGEVHQYLAMDLCTISGEVLEEIKMATLKIGAIYDKTVKFLQKTPELYDLLQLPENTREAVRIASNFFSYICRFDLIVNNGQIKVIEANCDTPTGEVETAIGNEIACDHFGVKSPNALEDSIEKAFKMIKEEYGIGEDDIVYFASYHWHEEDRKTTEFFMKWSGLNAKYIGMKDLRISPEGVFTESGDKIHYLYRLYPLEYFSQDKGANGEPIGDLFLEHVAKGNVKLINPPSAFLGQVKTVMAVVWALRENNHPIFSDEEHKDIENYFLPTYFGAEPLKNTAYVQKPIWGREGGGVTIIRADGTVENQDKTDYYFNQPKIYQQYMEMPKVTVQTWNGPYEGSLLVGSFLIAGEACGVFLRVGGTITGNLSMCVPLTVKK